MERRLWTSAAPRPSSSYWPRQDIAHDDLASLTRQFANARIGSSLKRIGAGRMRQKVFEIGMPSGQGATRRPAANSVSISRRGTGARPDMTKRFACVDGSERRHHEAVQVFCKAMASVSFSALLPSACRRSCDPTHQAET